MHVSIEQETDDGTTQQYDFFGVSDLQKEDDGYLLFWPYWSPLCNFETPVKGTLITAGEESLLNEETLEDAITWNNDSHTVAVPCENFRALQQATQFIKDKDTVPTKDPDQLTIIEEDPTQEEVYNFEFFSY